MKVKKGKSNIDNENFLELEKTPSEEELLASPKSEAGLLEYLEDKYSIKANPDQAVYQLISQRVKENNGYCPCKIVKNPDTRCICKEFKLKDSEGPCLCRKYIKVLNNLEDFKKKRLASASRIIH